MTFRIFFYRNNELVVILIHWAEDNVLFFSQCWCNFRGEASVQSGICSLLWAQNLQYHQKMRVRECMLLWETSMIIWQSSTETKVALWCGLKANEQAWSFHFFVKYHCHIEVFFFFTTVIIVYWLINLMHILLDKNVCYKCKYRCVRNFCLHQHCFSLTFLACSSAIKTWIVVSIRMQKQG